METDITETDITESDITRMLSLARGYHKPLQLVESQLEHLQTSDANVTVRVTEIGPPDSVPSIILPNLSQICEK